MKILSRVPPELGPYRLIEFLGRGGMGEVWLVQRRGSSKPRALKILRPELALDREYRRRFFREAEIGTSLEHGRIVSVLSYGEARGYLYLEMAFVDGIDLAGFCTKLAEADERIPIVGVGYIMAEVFEALQHAHNRLINGKPRGVIHRDVTPRNVLISSEGEVYLTDFGIARYEAELSDETSGTLQYIAPEQARGEACFGSDIYGAAGVLHFMLTGQPPRQVTRGRELSRSLTAPPPALGRVDVPEPLERLRVMGLEPDPEQRLRSCREALAIIGSWDGYRKATEILTQFYRRHIGPSRSGMSGMFPEAEELIEGATKSAPVVQVATSIGDSARMTVKVMPTATEVEDEDDSWNRLWWRDEDGGEDDDDDREVEQSAEEDEDDEYLMQIQTQRYIEPDAPKLFRRPRRRRTVTLRTEAGLPGIPMGGTIASPRAAGSSPPSDEHNCAPEAGR